MQLYKDVVAVIAIQIFKKKVEQILSTIGILIVVISSTSSWDHSRGMILNKINVIKI